jgi:hypothetical protein
MINDENKDKSPPLKEPFYEEVMVNDFIPLSALTAGGENICQKFCQIWDLTVFLNNKVLQKDQIKSAKVRLIGRMSHPRSEREIQDGFITT